LSDERDASQAAHPLSFVGVRRYISLPRRIADRQALADRRRFSSLEQFGEMFTRLLDPQEALPPDELESDAAPAGPSTRSAGGTLFNTFVHSAE